MPARARRRQRALVIGQSQGQALASAPGTSTAPRLPHGSAPTLTTWIRFPSRPSVRTYHNSPSRTWQGHLPTSHSWWRQTRSRRAPRRSIRTPVGHPRAARRGVVTHFDFSASCLCLESCHNGCMRRSSKPLPKDPNELAHEIVRLSTTELTKQARDSTISEYLSQIGHNGGLKGGKARAEVLSPERRRAIARKAAKTRWSKKGV